jgi:membrane-associated phospholipid phosphatase
MQVLALPLMERTSAHRVRALVLGSAALTLSLGACADPTATPSAPAGPQLSAVKFWDVGSSVAWNQMARDLNPAGSSPAAQARLFTYLSVAQYNAIIAAEDAKDGGNHASPAAAAAGASVIVLKSFFPASGALIDAKLAAQRAATPWPGEQKNDFAAGEAIGRAVGAAVVAYAATDGVNLTVPPPNPGGPGNWTGVNPLGAMYGARTFALESGDQFRPPPPPPFGSDAYNAALQEIRAISDGLTATQLAIAQFWAPKGPAYLNSVAAEMIVSHHNSEREAARVLALGNMAVFDVLNACFDAKFAYYLIRPSQADPQIHLPVGLPNHPSYPSGHSCVTSAYATVLASVFPDESDRLHAMVVEAGLSRMYGGLHYRFDCEVGQELGRNVAEYVMSVTAGGHTAIPLD